MPRAKVARLGASSEGFFGEHEAGSGVHQRVPQGFRRSVKFLSYFSQQINNAFRT